MVSVDGDHLEVPVVYFNGDEISQKNASDVELDDLVDVQTAGGGWVRSSPATVCGAEYENNNYTKNNTGPYCGPHCGPSVRSCRLVAFCRVWGLLRMVLTLSWIRLAGWAIKALLDRMGDGSLA
jgi:hypothetical protein